MNLNKKIGIGSVQFGMDYGISNNSGKTTVFEVEKILNSALSLGVEIIDTARAYGDSEIVLGKCLNMRQFKIVSKFMPSETDGDLLSQFEKSCNDLNVDNLYAYIAHRPSNLVNEIKDWNQLLALKNEGKVSKIGFSLNTPSELEALLQKQMIPDLIQVPFNYFDRRFEKMMLKLKEQGCEIHTRSSFLQGLFFVDIEHLSDYFNEIKDLVGDLQVKFKNDLSSVLLKYVVSKPYIDVVIMGVETEQQLLGNIVGLQNATELVDLEVEISDSILMPSNWPKK